MSSKQQHEPDAVSIPAQIISLRDHYRERRERTLIEAAAAAISINIILTADSVDIGAVTPQMAEAFELAYPNDVLLDRLSELDFSNTAALTGFMSNWRGKYFEVLVRDELNSGSQVGGLVLAEGQSAVLAADISQPGWDLQIVDEGGVAISEIQLKATDSISYVKDALEKYPDVNILATEETAEAMIDAAVTSSGIENSELTEGLHEPLNDVIDSPLVDGLEMLGTGLPVLLITGIEGTMWLTGRQKFSKAMSRSVEKASKSGIAMAVGGLVALAGAGILTVPATFLTRIGIARHDVHDHLEDTIRANTETVRGLVNARSTVRAN